jgi:hypothetical protein
MELVLSRDRRLYGPDSAVLHHGQRPVRGARPESCLPPTRVVSARNRPRRGGAPDRIRTCDLRLRRPTLYPLSYRRQCGPSSYPTPDGPARGRRHASRAAPRTGHGSLARSVQNLRGDHSAARRNTHVLGWRDHWLDPVDPADPVAYGQPVAGTVRTQFGAPQTVCRASRRPLRRGAFFAAGFANRKGIFHARFPALPLPKPTHGLAISGESLCEQRTHDRSRDPGRSTVWD